MFRRTLILSACVVALCVAGPAQAAPVSSHAMLYTCCTPPAMKERILSEAAASGAEYVRVDVELNGIFEGAGSREEPDWRALDEVTRLARRNHVKVLGLVLGVPGWLSTCPERGADAPRCAARDPAEFGRLAGEVAAHARGSIDHWEILNEPDADWAFKGGPDDYAKMLSAAYDAIKDQAPDAQVVLGGVERPARREWIEQVLATPGVDAAHKFDIAAAHLRLRAPGSAADLAGELRTWRGLLARHGFRGPTWVTEFGYPADPAFQRDPAFRDGDASQAAFLRQALPLIAGAGASQLFVTLRDNLYGEYLSEGIEHIDEARADYPAIRRPAFAVVRELASRAPPETRASSELRLEDRLQLEFERLAIASRGAGRELAAAIQEGTSIGHGLLALELSGGQAL